MRIVLVDADNRQVPEFRLHREKGSDDYLFVLFKSPAKLLVQGSYVSVDKGVCVLFERNCIQSYYGDGDGNFLHDFMHFEPESELEVLLTAGIPKGEPLQLTMWQPVSDSIAAIREEHRSGFGSCHREILDSMGRIFIYRLKEQTEHAAIDDGRRKIFRALYDLRTQIYREPQRDWSIDAVCRLVCMSRSYFQHQYKSFFHVSCTEDVINARIAAAKALLTSSDLPVNEVAEKCGYQSVEHFIRQFRKYTGVTPARFRS